MDVFYHYLEAIEAARLCDLNFRGESLDQILVHYSVGCSEECQDIGYEMTLIRRQLGVPLFDVHGQVYFFSSPVGGLRELVKLPYVWVANWKENKSAASLLQQRLVDYRNLLVTRQVNS